MGCCAGKRNNTYYGSNYSLKKADRQTNSVVTDRQGCQVTKSEILSLFNKVRKANIDDSLKHEIKHELALMSQGMSQRCPDIEKFNSLKEMVESENGGNKA